MRSIANFTTKLSVAGLVMCLTMGTTLANTLSEIEINPQGSGYGIVLKTDTATPIKKVVSANNKLSVILKDINISQDLNTVYNNVENIENVTIQPLSKKDVKIILKGKNVANSKVSFNENSSLITKAPSQAIELTAPVSHYKPVYTPEMFIDEEENTLGSQTSNPELNAILTKMNISRETLVSVKSYAKKILKKANSLLNGDTNSMTLIGIIMIAGVLLMNFRRKPAKHTLQKSDKPIGLTKANIEREIELNRGLTNSLKNDLNKQTSAQMGYGLKAYQQSQKNPYTSTPETTGISGIARRKPLSSNGTIKRQTLPAQTITKDSAPLKRNNLPQITKTQTTHIKNTGIKTQAKPITKTAKHTTLEPDTDSLKFLESITKIYENSGRTDLAKGLKDNLKKAQLSQI